MAVSINITKTPADGVVPEGKEFTLEAEVEGGAADSWEWHREGKAIPDAKSNRYQGNASKDTVGEYEVRATVDDNTVTQKTKVRLGSKDVPSPAHDKEDTETPPVFHKLFAGVTALIAGVIGALILKDVLGKIDDVTKADLVGEKGDNALAVLVAVPLTVVGGALVVLGAWMAAVEWRGRFAPDEKPAAGTETRSMEVKLSEVIAAIGKLRGAALALVVGAILMLGAAWIAQSAAGTETDTAPATTDSTTTGDTTTSDTPTGTGTGSDATQPGANGE